MKYPLYTHVVLAEDLPAHGLRRGDFATVVEHYAGAGGQEPGYEIEVFNAVGETVCLTSVRESQLEAPRENDRLCVRPAVLAA